MNYTVRITNTDKESKKPITLIKELVGGIVPM